MSSTEAKSKPGKAGATSPYAPAKKARSKVAKVPDAKAKKDEANKKKGEQAKKAAVKERGGGQSKFQRAYSEICTKKMSPPVQADNHVMSSLASQTPLIEITHENFGKAEVQALARLLNMPDLVRSVSGIVFKSNEKDKKKAASLARNQKKAAGGKKSKATKKEKEQGVAKKIVEKQTDDKAKEAKEAPQIVRPPAELVKTIAKLLFRASSMTQFSVVGVNLSLTDVRMLGRGLSLNKKISLESINFVRVPLGDKGLSELCPALCASGAESVRVVGCNVTDFGGVYIASIIRSHGSKRDEAIWSAGLRGAAVKAHSEECPERIGRMGCLVLDFSHNRLGDNSAQVIGEALANDAWLLGLNVGGNLITEKGGRWLYEGLEKNSCLRALVTADNKSIGEEVEKLISDKITGTADTSAPSAAQLPVVMRAMKAWSRWRAGRPDPIDAKPIRATSPVRAASSSIPDRAGVGKKSPAKEKENKANEIQATEAKKSPMTSPARTAAGVKRSVAPVSSSKTSKRTPPNVSGAPSPASTSKTPPPTPLSKKEALSAYNQTLSQISPSILDLYNSKFTSLDFKSSRLDVTHMMEMPSAPPLLVSTCSQVLTVLEIPHSDWNSICSQFGSLEVKRVALKRLQKFTAQELVWALTSKKVAKAIEDGNGVEVKSLEKVSSFGGLLFKFLQTCRSMSSSVPPSILSAGKSLRSAYKSPVPKSLLNLPPKIEKKGKVVVVPSVKPTKKSKKPELLNQIEGENSDEIISKLGSMVTKLSTEINRLEKKISMQKKSPVKSPPKSQVKKVRSPKGTKGGDPEIMKEISKAVAERLKEIWTL